MGPLRCLAVAAVVGSALASGQAIEFESNGLKYHTLTKGGVTVMVASMPSHIKEWAIMQVAVSNGSPIAWIIRPEDFSFQKLDGPKIQATPANVVVDSLINKASRSDVIHLVTAYENALYGMQRFNSTNGYESRRQAAFAEVSSAKIKAAAAASAIALVLTRLMPGQSTDGAIFYPTGGKALGAGKLTVNAAGEIFEFEPEPAAAHSN